MDLAERLNNLLHALRAYVQRNSAVAEEGLQDTLRRFRALSGVALAFNIGYALVFFNDPAWHDGTVHARWVQAIASTHVTTGALILLIGLLIHRFLARGARSRALAVALLVAFCATGLAFGTALSAADQLVSPNATSFTILAMVIGMMTLIRPILSFLVLSLGYVGFFVAVGLTQSDPTTLDIVRSHGFAGAGMSIVVSWLVWHQYAKSVQLRRELSAANAALEAKQQELTFLATRDSLTGLYVRREFVRLTEMELARSARQATSTGLVMIDIDHFKRINDQHGHPAGDAVLKAVAALLAAEVRTTDVLGRLGGEEFALLVPDATHEGIAVLAEKLRQAIHAQALPAAGVSIPVTVSLGFSLTAPGQRTSYDSLYASADAALYAAKQRGRDRVEFGGLVP